MVSFPFHCEKRSRTIRILDPDLLSFDDRLATMNGLRTGSPALQEISPLQF